MGSLSSYLQVVIYVYVCRYAGMLKTHKQNLIPENEFHIREERVKAQQSDAKEKEKEKDSGKSEKQSATAAASSKAEVGRSEKSSTTATSSAAFGLVANLLPRADLRTYIYSLQYDDVMVWRSTVQTPYLNAVEFGELLS